jgi:hypothetical protein
VTLDKIPIVMQRSAPMCMKALYNRMNGSPHHLKHDGRMQFGLFLKGIGVTLEDSIAWWRESMMKVRLRIWGAGGWGGSVWVGWVGLGWVGLGWVGLRACCRQANIEIRIGSLFRAEVSRRLNVLG